MIRSMTGFAATSHEEDGVRVNVTLKSVNHRFLDLGVKAPQSLAALDARLRQQLQQRLARGRVEVSVTLETTALPEREVVLDEGLLARISEAFEAARARGLVTGGLTASDLLRVPQLIEIRPRAATGEAADAAAAAVHAVVERALGEAIDALVVMRETEGRFLAADLEARLAVLTGYVEALERLAREGQAALETRLRDRLADLPADLQADAAALAQEVVRFVARSDVDEEIVRLRSHVEHWRTLAGGPEPCGRKLDFLVQEMNREFNTIGSKIEGTAAGQIVIDAKAELERVKEQVQNVE